MSLAPRGLLASAALASALWSQAVTVTQNKRAPDGSPANGTASIRINTPCVAPGSLRVGDKTINVSFTAGNFSASLVRTDTCVAEGASGPGGVYYTVNWQLSGGRVVSEQWQVGAGGAITVISTPPKPPYLFQVAQIDGSAYSNGLYCVLVTGGVVSLSSTCPGGGSGGQSWAGITSGTWAGLTSSSWSGIVP